MRIKCVFFTNQLPVSYHSLFSSLIKKCIQTSDEEYYQNLYYYQKRKNKRTKPFSFAVLLHDYEMKKDAFHIRGQVDLYVSSADQQWFVHFYNGLLKQKDFQFREFALRRDRMMLLKEPTISEGQMICRTMSPLFVKNRDNHALSPFQPEFQRELNYISNLISQNERGYGLQSPIRLIPIHMKKTVVKETIREHQELRGKRYLYVDAYKGKFILEGNPSDLQFLYQSSLGFKRNFGYGMIEVVPD